MRIRVRVRVKVRVRVRVRVCGTTPALTLTPKPYPAPPLPHGARPGLALVQRGLLRHRRRRRAARRDRTHGGGARRGQGLCQGRWLVEQRAASRLREAALSDGRSPRNGLARAAPIARAYGRLQRQHGVPTACLGLPACGAAPRKEGRKDYCPDTHRGAPFRGTLTHDYYGTTVTRADGHQTLDPIRCTLCVKPGG